MNFPVKYDPLSPSGLSWAEDGKWGKKKNGMPAGSRRKDGYWNLFCRGIGQDLCHRVIWVLFYGPIPEGFTVDHVNRKRGDNRIENLRLLTAAGQAKNRETPASSRFKGVSWDKGTGKWRAYTHVDGKQKHLGLFLTELEAHQAVCKVLSVT